MKRNQSAAQRVKFASKPTPLSDIPCFQGIAGQAAKQATSQQFASDLGDFFGSIPGMKEIFSKGPLKHQSSTTPDCEECEQEYGNALIKVGEILDNVYHLAVCASQMNDRDTNPRERLQIMLPAMLSLIAEGQTVVNEAM